MCDVILLRRVLPTTICQELATHCLLIKCENGLCSSRWLQRLSCLIDRFFYIFLMATNGDGGHSLFVFVSVYFYAFHFLNFATTAAAAAAVVSLLRPIPRRQKSLKLNIRD